jgi:hypothetical protein
VKYSDVLDQLPTDRDTRRVYGEPYETTDGSTVILTEKPLGVFVIRAGRASWVPAVDKNRVALIGALIGLFSALFASLAVLRQPPWPRITITDYR